jgi:methylmalonyl-CoA mutase N-terminal domain/subunit
MYLAVAEKQGVDIARQVSGTLQNDILKEYIAQKEYIFPPRPSMRLITDQFAFAAERVPRWNTISISGYHIREAGSTALQELAFTLRDGMEYVEYGMRAGLEVDAFAPRLSFFFNSHNDFFEEIAKFRAARRIWATVMRERYGAANPRSWMLRFHTQTAGCSLTAQQPVNNVVRTTVQALAALLGGTQSLHTNGYDEALALPTEEAATLALRTQQILAHESGITGSVDPLGGSWYVESLTDRIEAEARALIEEVDRMGGAARAVERGWFQEAIARSAYAMQQAVESGKQVIVGVNRFTENGEPPMMPMPDYSALAAQQMERVRQARKRRDQARVDAARAALEQAARGSDSLMPRILEAVRARATLGEISDTLRSVWGVYRP